MDNTDCWLYTHSAKYCYDEWTAQTASSTYIQLSTVMMNGQHRLLAVHTFS